jgi:hypothetical protein
MNGVLVEHRAWAGRRWWGMVAAVFALQLGLIFWLGDRKPIQPRAPSPAPQVRMAASASEPLLAMTDPTLFALPHWQGFSGSAWLEVPTPTSPEFVWSEAPQWLPLAAGQIGAAFRQFVATNLSNPLQAVALFEPGLRLPQLGPAGADPGLPAPVSSVQLTGELAGRKLATSLELRSWASPELLTNTVLQLLVDAEGKPISITLMSGCGLAEADQNAVQQARALRFAPSRPGQVEAPADPLSDLSWGELIFEWRTVPANAPGPGVK